jgi:hypothetical protein
LAASPSFPATVALSLFSFVVQWYFCLPPRPQAELDEKDWHASFEKANQKYVTEKNKLQQSAVPLLDITLISS